MSRLKRSVAALSLAAGLVVAVAAGASACTTVEGQLPDPVPAFRLAFVGRLVAIERPADSTTDAPYPTAFRIDVERVLRGWLPPGIRRFTVSDGCRAIPAEVGDRIAWALTAPPDLTEWNTAAWRISERGAELLVPWREWYPFVGADEPPGGRNAPARMAAGDRRRRPDRRSRRAGASDRLAPRSGRDRPAGGLAAHAAGWSPPWPFARADGAGLMAGGRTHLA